MSTAIYDLNGVGKKIQFERDGSVIINQPDGSFKMTAADEVALVALIAAAAVSDDQAPNLGQVKALILALASSSNNRIDRLVSLLSFIVNDAVAAIGDLPAANAANKEMVIIVSDAIGLKFYRSDATAWNEFTPVEGQLITFATNETLAGNFILQDDAVKVANVFDNHSYTFQSATELKDNGAATGLELKLATLKSELETLIEANRVALQLQIDANSINSQAAIDAAQIGCVYKKVVIIDKGGLAALTELPRNIIVTNLDLKVIEAFDVAFTNQNIKNPAGVVILNTANWNLKKKAMNPNWVFEEFASTGNPQFSIDFSGGAPTKGKAILEITYTGKYNRNFVWKAAVSGNFNDKNNWLTDGGDAQAIYPLKSDSLVTFSTGGTIQLSNIPANTVIDTLLVTNNTTVLIPAAEFANLIATNMTVDEGSAYLPY